MKKVLHFTLQEFNGRLAKVKKEMVRQELDVLLLSEPANQNYVTGYDGYSFYAPQLVVVSLNHEQPIWIGRLVDRVQAVIYTYLSEDNIRAYPDRYVASAELSAWDFMADVIKELGCERSRIGVEMDSFYYTARTHADLTKALPNASFVDSNLTNWIRMTMSPAEIALMRQAGSIADAMMQRAIDVIEPGVRQCDVAAAVYAQAMSGTPEFGGTYSCAPHFLCVGEHQIAPHAPWTDEPLPDSTVVNLELFGNRHRYQVNLARSICVGTPAPIYVKLSEIVVESLNAALDSVSPGRACEEVAEVFRKTLAKHGYEKEVRLGYPIGIGFPPSVQFRTCSIRPGDKTILQPGMCFHAMSGLWYEDIGITITQSFAVTDKGYEALSSIPRKLYCK